MLFSADSHAAIARGEITLTFRLWARPKAKVGGRYRVGTVEIEVDDIELMPFGVIDPSDYRPAGVADSEELRRRAAHAGPIDDETLLYRIEFHVIGPHRPRAPITPDASSIASVIAKLDAMDRRSAHGPWTRAALSLIGEYPGVVSTELAAQLGRPRAEFKADVRKLKALGLTESLEVGYRLTELGLATLRT